MLLLYKDNGMPSSTGYPHSYPHGQLIRIPDIRVQILCFLVHLTPSRCCFRWRSHASLNVSYLSTFCLDAIDLMGLNAPDQIVNYAEF